MDVNSFPPKRHPVRNLQYMKAISNVLLKIRNNKPVLPHALKLECVHAALKISENTSRRILKEFEICNSPGKKLHSFCWLLLEYYNYISKEMYGK
jgi:hypothetical protein